MQDAQNAVLEMAQPWLLIMTAAQKQALARPAPKPVKRADSVADALGDIADASVDNLRQILSVSSSSVAALAEGANVQFAQMSAAMALDRAMRTAAAAFGMRVPCSSPFGYAAPMLCGVMPAAFAPKTPNPMWLFNPWLAAAEMMEAAASAIPAKKK